MEQENRTEKRRKLLESVLMIVLLLLLVWQGCQIRQLSDSVSALQRGLDDRVEFMLDRIYGSEERLAEEIRALMQPVSGHTIKPVGLDAEGTSFLMDLTVTLKEVGADTAVMLEVDAGEDWQAEISLAGDGAGNFQTKEPVAFPLEAQTVRLSAVVNQNGVSKRQWLAETSPRQYLPLQQNAMGWSGEFVYREGTLYMIDLPTVYLDDAQGGPAQGKEVKFLVYRNGETVFEGLGVRDRGAGSYVPQDWPAEIEAAPGDEILLTMSCRDENGLGYEFLLLAQRITPEGRVENTGNTEIDAEAWPRLFW